MQNDLAFELKLIENEIEDLMDPEMVAFLESHPNQFTTFSLEWIDLIARFLHYRDGFAPEDTAKLLEKFAAIKPAAQKLKLRWYE